MCIRDSKYGSKSAKLFLLKWGISIKFFKKFYLRSNTKYYGELSDPNKNLIFYINLVKNKINYTYVKLFVKI